MPACRARKLNGIIFVQTKALKQFAPNLSTDQVGFKLQVKETKLKVD